MVSIKPKVVVAMSGGVDSSVAACLLVEQGFDVVGLFMRVGAEEPTHAKAGERNRQGCCSASDASDARFVAGMLDVPFFSLNFKNDFDELIDYFSDEYASGRTPNPCVVCNQKFKFGKIIDYADAVGATYVATGHYARIDHADGRRVLRRSADAGKDQTYVLFGLKRALLDRILFPLGRLTKEQVRNEARRFNLPNADKPDSVEICFVPDRDYARVVKQRRPDAFVAGDVVDADGRVIASHRGVGHYTIGQRRGLGIAAGRPIYVTKIDRASNTVTVGDRDGLLKRVVLVERINLLRVDVPDVFRASAQIRYLHRAAAATITLLDNNCAEVVFDDPQAAPTPGQAIVFYDDDVVVGGGWITGTKPAEQANEDLART